MRPLAAQLHRRIFGSLICLVVVCLTATAASFRAQLEPDTVYQGQGASLLLIFEGGQPDRLPPLPRVATLRRVVRRSDDHCQRTPELDPTCRYSVLRPCRTYTIPPIVVRSAVISSPPNPAADGRPGQQAAQRANAQPSQALLRIRAAHERLRG
jgi:hypothetical protein